MNPGKEEFPMRIRRKPWARPELAVCPYFYENAYAQRGHWHTLFTRPQPMYLELGIGNGAFIAQAAAAHPEINYMGVAGRQCGAGTV